MKDIEDMNLLELADDLTTLPSCSVRPYVLDTIDRLRVLHDLTRWIPVSERLPTREDADAEGYVWVSAIRILTATRSNDSWLWSQVSLDGGIAYKPTHWKRIDKPEGV
jgi:hypothetical protein